MPREVKIRFAAHLYADLEAYGELYRAEYDEAIDIPKLAAEILRQFLQTDRGFRAWKRRRDRLAKRAHRTDGPEVSATGERTRA